MCAGLSPEHIYLLTLDAYRSIVRDRVRSFSAGATRRSRPPELGGWILDRLAVAASFVELTGIEPVASGLQSPRSPS